MYILQKNIPLSKRCFLKVLSLSKTRLDQTYMFLTWLHHPHIIKDFNLTSHNGITFTQENAIGIDNPDIKLDSIGHYQIEHFKYVLRTNVDTVTFEQFMIGDYIKR